MDEEACTLMLSKGDPVPCGRHKPGEDGKCTECHHLAACHDLRPRDPPWRYSP